MKNNSPSVEYDNYSRIYDITRAANSETVEKLIRVLHVDSGSTLLDMGCGTGNYSAALQSVARNVIGIDASMGMIGQARTKSPALQLVYGNVMSLPFDSQTFDGAFTIQVLHHIKNKEVFLKGACRVLRKGAYLAIHSCSHSQLRAFWCHYYFPKGLELNLARIPDTDEIASLLREAGFSDIGVEICYEDDVIVLNKPEYYLEKDYRDGDSTFALLTEEEIELGCQKLREDIASGAVESIVRQSSSRIASEVGGSALIYGRKAVSR